MSGEVKLQKFILGKKNHITCLGGILIALAFISEWGLGNADLFRWALIIASALGAAPIAIQAYQALKVKVVSIDVLVTIAVLGAFLIGEFEESAIVNFHLWRVPGKTHTDQDQVLKR